MFFFQLAGKFTDKYPPYLTLTISFGVRAFAIMCFLFLKTPDSIFTYLVTILLILGTVLENITIDGTFTKNLPKDIRGTLNGAYAFFGNLGLLIFSKIGGSVYDSVGPAAPFVIVMVCDLIFIIFL